MEVSSVSSFPVAMATSKTSGGVQVSMLKKAIDMESAIAETLIDATAKTPPLPANPNIGRIINTTA